MSDSRKVPDDPLAFIQRCVRERRVYWTYHVNMRLVGRHISRNEIFAAVDSYSVIESYPDDKYLPSYLVFASGTRTMFHVLFATDVTGNNVRIVTAYHPKPDEWEADLKTRKVKP